MKFLSDKPLLITDTILRDAHQSQAATRMRIEDMLPACEVLDSIGNQNNIPEPPRPEVPEAAPSTINFL